MIRLLFGALCAGIALLSVVEAPNHRLWLLALGATEWGHWLALPSLLVFFPGWRDSWGRRVGAALGLAAAILALSPLLRAVPVAGRVPGQLVAAFGQSTPRSSAEAPPRPAPLVFLDLWRGVGSPQVSVQTVAYATKNGQQLWLDLYQYQPPPSEAPTAKAGAPGILVIHGGSWQDGARTELAALNTYLAARGYVVAAISYRLAPRWPFPAARDDVREAIAYLKAKAVGLGLDPQRLVLLGRSAGGQLALLVAYETNDPAIRGVVAFYTPADMRFGYANPSRPAVIDSRGILKTYLGGSPDEVSPLYDAASPLNFVARGTPPTLLVHGGRDELIFPAQSERLAVSLTQAGRPHLFLRLPWATHGCDVNFSGPCGQISTYAIERFLAAVLH
ncbi:MAG: alpha/beta hydrolase [Nitrospiraceae bacterium]